MTLYHLLSVPQYASVVKDGEHYMTAADFVTRFLGLIPGENYNDTTVRLLANVVDTTKDGLVFCVRICKQFAMNILTKHPVVIILHVVNFPYDSRRDNFPGYLLFYCDHRSLAS